MVNRLTPTQLVRLRTLAKDMNDDPCCAQQKDVLELTESLPTLLDIAEAAQKVVEAFEEYRASHGYMRREEFFGATDVLATLVLGEEPPDAD